MKSTEMQFSDIETHSDGFSIILAAVIAARKAGDETAQLRVADSPFDMTSGKATTIIHATTTGLTGQIVLALPQQKSAKLTKFDKSRVVGGLIEVQKDGDEIDTFVRQQLQELGFSTNSLTMLRPSQGHGKQTGYGLKRIDAELADQIVGILGQVERTALSVDGVADITQAEDVMLQVLDMITDDQIVSGADKQSVPAGAVAGQPSSAHSVAAE